MNPQNEKKFLSTELNKHDRKVLDKYTKFYTNFIESPTARNEMLDVGQSPEKMD